MSEVIEVLHAAVLAIFFYVVLIISFRILGKRELNQLSSLDVVMNIFIANMAASGIVAEEYWLEALAGVILVVSLQLIVNYVQVRYPKTRKLTDEEPSMLILNGRVNYEELKRLRIDLDELVMMLRINEIVRLEDLLYVIMERDGDLAVFTKDNTPAYFPLPIIISGQIKQNVLRYFNITEEDFLKILARHELTQLETLKIVYLHHQHLYVYLRDEYFVVALNKDEYLELPR